MRTTINVDDALLREAKTAALQSGRTLSEFFEDALRETLSRRKESRNGRRVKLPTFEGRGLQPGVDLDDSAALLDLMERTDAPG